MYRLGIVNSCEILNASRQESSLNLCDYSNRFLLKPVRTLSAIDCLRKRTPQNHAARKGVDKPTRESVTFRFEKLLQAQIKKGHLLKD